MTFVDANPETAEKAAVDVKAAAKNGAKVSAATLDAPLGDVVVLAVWYGTNIEIARQLGTKLAGKVVIDIANPLNSTYDGLTTAADSSSAEDLAKALVAGAKVVKAFNTTYAGTLVAGEVGGQKLDVFIAGDDADAKAKVAQLVTDGGMRAIDAGPLHRARSELSDDELEELKRLHQHSAELIEKEDEEFLQGMDGADVLAAYEAGIEQVETIVAEQTKRKNEEEIYLANKAELAERGRALFQASEEEAGEESGDEEESGEEEASEASEYAEAAEEEEAIEEAAVVVASADTVVNTAPRIRRPPAPSRDRIPTDKSAVLTAAAGLDGIRGGQPLDRMGLAEAFRTVARRLGPPSKSEAGIEQRFFIGQAVFPFPDERRLLPGEADANARKIQSVIPTGIPGVPGNMSLVASGGLCAPLENIYSMPNFAVLERPVRNALPSFQADRGGVNLPTATTIGDIDSAITVIEEAEDALGGTYATKSCQDLECPSFVETAVTVIAHCREYGNLNARAWPEKIAHENDLTMAAHARTAEQYLLDRIKALSINVTVAQALGAYADLVDAMLRAQAGIRYRLRMSPDAQFRALLPSWVAELITADTVKTQFDRWQAQAELAARLARYRVVPVYYIDTPSTGTSQGFADEAAGALDAFPSAVQWAIYPEGEFIHLDGGTLDLGLVRDSTLNSTNDFQIFGENFENVARIGPAQGALWVTSTVTATGEVAAPA